MKIYPEYKASGIDWLGEIPSHWELYKSKYLFNLNSGETLSTEDFAKDGTYPVYGGNGLRGYHDKYNIEGEHILIGRVGALCGNIHFSANKAWITEHALILNLLKHANLHWLGKLLEAMNLRQYSNASAQPVIASSTIGNLKLPIPPLEEQKAIADYLDEICGKIDALVAEKQAQVEDLLKYRTSLITETVTHGLNPDAPLHFSGIDWIGNIPEHWIISKFKFSLREIKDGTHFSPDTTTDGYPYVTATDVRGIGINYENTKKVSLDDFTKLVQSGCEIYKDDVLLVKDGATTGRIGMKDDDTPAVTLSSVAMLRAKSDSVPKFTYYFLQSSIIQNQISIAMAGAAMPRITLEKLGNFIAVIPPYAEQQQIAEYLDKKTAKIDALIDDLNQQLDELALYRKAVISEAVTGKVDVRDWKPKD